MQTELWPRSSLKPAWKVVAYRGKRGEIRLGQSYVRADSERLAREIGKHVLKTIGVRGQFFVHAMPYDPGSDRDMIAAGFVQEVR